MTWKTTGRPAMPRMSMRIGDLELFTCSEALLTDEPLVTAQIAFWETAPHWETATHFAIAYWQRSAGGYELRFVGDRPFKHGDPRWFWKLAALGQSLLDDYFRQTL